MMTDEVTKDDAFRIDPPDGYPYIELTHEEIQIMRNEARKIVGSEPATINQGKDFSNNISESIDRGTMGICGEYVLAKYYGLDYDRIFYDDPDGGIDLVLPNGLTVQVKTRDGQRYKEPDLGIPINQKLKANVYYLVEKNDKYFSLIGWATKQTVQKADIVTFSVDNRCVYRNELNDP